MDLFANQHKMAKVKKFKPWLMRCLYHKFIDKYRKRKSMGHIENIDDPKIASSLSYQPDFDLKVMHQQVLIGLQTLSASQRAVVALHDINGYTLPELAEIMDKPLGTLKSDLHRGRAKLKKLLKLQPSDIKLRHYN